MTRAYFADEQLQDFYPPPPHIKETWREKARRKAREESTGLPHYLPPDAPDLPTMTTQIINGQPVRVQETPDLRGTEAMIVYWDPRLIRRRKRKEAISSGANAAGNIGGSFGGS